MTVSRCLVALLLSSVLNCVVRAERTAGEVFVGTSPCGESIRPLLGIPGDATADLMQWRLTLQPSGTYSLRCAYSPAVPNTNGVTNPTIIERQGKWTTARGTKSDPAATVYQLNGAVQMAKVGDHLLHVLNNDRSLMVGNGGWSYTLNRADAVEQPGDREAALANPAGSEESYRIAPPATGPGVFGVFDGRTPCHGVARVVKSPRANEPRYWKAKWRVTLYKDPSTGAPTTYKLEGSLFGRNPREGKWSIVRDEGNDAAATVYRLEAAGGQATLNLLKGDDNVVFFLDEHLKPLVGHADFSYTLNRVPAQANPAAPQ